MFPRSAVAVASACVVLSGAAALVYQVAWQRLLALTTGVSIPSVAAITAAFMAGLGIGSHLGGLESRAVPDGTGWRLSGIKRWNGSAWTGTMSVFARVVEPGGRARGLVGLVVRQDDAGVVIGPESLTMGIRGIVQNVVEFRDVRVSAERVLGVPGQGMAVVEAHGFNIKVQKLANCREPLLPTV